MAQWGWELKLEEWPDLLKWAWDLELTLHLYLQWRWVVKPPLQPELQPEQQPRPALVPMPELVPVPLPLPVQEPPEEWELVLGPQPESELAAERRRAWAWPGRRASVLPLWEPEWPTAEHSACTAATPSPWSRPWR